jgi:membrane-bound lytic murein transglycosylase B
MKINLKKTTILTILISTFIHNNKRHNYYKKKLDELKKQALYNGISTRTLKNITKTNINHEIIKYNKIQPKLYEDTYTYILKYVSIKRIIYGNLYYFVNKKLINQIELEYQVNKNLLMALMGIETNYGLTLGNYDIITSLTTLSFDKRRGKYFAKELIILLKLIEEKKFNYKELKGSIAGAYGNFQFMPSAIQKYAIDYNLNNKIELTEIQDSFASAANYLNKMGWKFDKPSRLKIELDRKIPKAYLNTSAINISYNNNFDFYKRYIISDYDINDINDKTKCSIIIPDNKLTPAYVVFSNFEVILKYNRSLKYALAICELMDKFSF